MMAYLRTAVSLIGFGFAIVQFFEQFHQMPGVSTARFPDAAWYLGLALIFCGVMAAVFSVCEYRWTAALPVERKFRAHRRHDEGGQADTALRHVDRPHPDRHIRLFRRAAAIRLAYAQPRTMTADTSEPQ